MMLYALAGGYIFYSIEGPEEKRRDQQKLDVSSKRSPAVQEYDFP